MFLVLISIFIPLLIGITMFFLKGIDRKVLNLLTIGTSISSLIFSIILCFMNNLSLSLFSITNTLTAYLKVDGLSNFFSVIISFIWIIVSIFAYKYLTIEEHENKFHTFYLLSLSMLLQLSYSGNLITMYISFEMATLVSMPLVMHSKTKESIQGATKYLYYSIGGAFLGLLGLFFITYYSLPGSEFILGGSLDLSKVGTNNIGFQIVILIMLIGFGAKAGMFPLHGWLPTAHPVAPSPASAVLSGIITKAGVLAIIRLVFFSIGIDYIKSTWVQYVWVSIILFTILLGSLMALIQKNLKKRLAYSSISQLSYVLLGIAMMNEDSLAGSLLHIASHAIIKVGLFLTAGAIIYYTGKHDIDELEGIGKKLPITMICFTILSLGLIGIPPTGGFVSKWYLATGSISSGLNILNIISPIVLLVSAILTAFYLLPISIKGFFIGENKEELDKIKESPLTFIPLIILASTIIIIGIFATPIVSIAKEIFF